MANEAEKVVVELLARVEGFDGKIRQSASSFGGEMKRIEASADKAERAVGTAMATTERSMQRAGQQSRLLGYQIADVGAQLSAGTSPFIVLAQQGSQVANALEGAKGKVGAFAAFLSGPWGAAMLAATTILGVFLTKTKDSADSIEDLVAKLKEQAQKTRDTEQANELFGRTLEGVSKAADEAEKAIEALRLAEKGEAEQTVENIRKALEQAEALRETTRARLADARALYEIQKLRASGPGEANERAALGLSGRIETIQRLEKELGDAEKQAGRLETALARAVSFRTVEQENASATDKINRKFDAMIDKAALAADASKKAQDQLRKEIQRINEAREAELKRLRDTEREKRRTDSSLPKVTGKEVAGLLGAPITSGKRTAAENRAAGGAANSYHLSGQAIDIPITVNGKPLTKEGIRSELEKAGVIIKELLGPGDKGHSDHFHIAFDKRRRGQDEIAKATARAADVEERRAQAFENELASLMSDEIDARQSLVESAEEIARLELDAIELSRRKYDDNLKSLVEQGKLHEDEAEQLRGINDERAKLRAELVKRREDERKFRMEEADRQRQSRIGEARVDDQSAILQDDLQSARTAKERRAIEQKLIDLQFESERLQNDLVIAYADRLRLQEGISDSEKLEADAAAEIARIRNDSLDQRKQNAEDQSARDNMSPLQDYFDRIPNTADEINEALESVAAGGLATFTDALTDAIVNFSSLKQVGLATLQAITAGLVRMAIQQVILRTIGQTLGSASIAATSAQAAAAGAAWAGPAALASLATLGANAGPAAAALASTTALATALGAVPKKDGGPIFGPGGPRDDKVLMAASPGEYVIKAKSASKLGRAALDRMNLTGELPGGYAGGGSIGGSIQPSNAPAAPSGGGKGGGISEAEFRRLEGALTRAAQTMPPVNLYPTLDKAAAFEAMLSDPGAQRIFFNFVSQNSAKFNSQLRR